MSPKENQKRVALVIGSGGLKCAAALGLWHVFQRDGIELSMVVGSSGGSIYAALIALGEDPQTAATATAEFWTSDLVAGYTSNLRAALTGKTRFTERSGLIDQQRVYDRLSRVYGDQTFADSQLPLFIVSTDLYSGEQVVHSTGSILNAVMASIAIPLIFPPWQEGERLLVDGGVSNPLPVDVAIKEGAEMVVAMGFEIPTRARMRSYSAVTTHFNSLYMNKLLKATFAFANLAHHAEIIPILPEFERSVGTFSGDQIPHIIEAGVHATQKQMAYIRRLVYQT
jgi:NTE family protein